MARLSLAVIFYALTGYYSNLFGQETIKAYWPKIIPLEKASITIYAPEPESFNGNVIEVRSAFSYYDGINLPIFGAMWLRAQVHINKAANHVFFDEIEMLDASFPDLSRSQRKNLQNLIGTVAPTWQFNSSYENFLRGLQRSGVSSNQTAALLNEPPNIYYESVPTELVFVDGEPIFENIDNSQLYQYAVNTPHFIVKSQSDEFYYLQAGNYWFRTKDFYAEWRLIDQPPQIIIRLKERADEYNPLNNNRIDKVNSSKPKLIVTIFPSQLIQTTGTPELSIIPNTDLYTVKNSPNDLIYDKISGAYYVLFAGRWYKSTALVRGQWQFVPPKEIPAHFNKMPVNSEYSKYRISIPGTPEAVNAALDNIIPQTAIIDRSLATITVEYDGEPDFKPIEDANLAYAVNTNVSVLRIAEEYFAVDAGVWFNSNSPTTGWKVATYVPEEVQDLPPSVPVYNMKFVYIYEASDKYVYTGYTGGYTGNFLYQGCVFYGTGYQYKPWYKSKYFSRPMTFAFGVSRRNTTSNVSVSVGIGYGYPGYYSPYGYGYGFGSYGYAHLNGNFDYKKGYERKALDPVNIYNNRPRGVVATESVRRNNPYEVLQPSPVPNDDTWLPPGNLYSTSNGDIYRQDASGKWSKRSDGVWVQTKDSPFKSN